MKGTTQSTKVEIRLILCIIYMIFSQNATFDKNLWKYIPIHFV